MQAPTGEDHFEAAQLRNRCRHVGIQIGTIDALIARLCTAHDLTLLTMDKDFAHMGGHVALKVGWVVGTGL